MDVHGAVTPAAFRLSSATLTWVALVALLAAVVGASMMALEPPRPLTRAAPLDRFSEARARDVVRRLSEEIGFRVNGTPEHAHAAELLASELRKIPRLEVEVQTVSGTQVFRTARLPPFVYRTLNVVARLPGRSTEAILIDAHFDTLLDSVGAADDAAGVAAIVESLRVLAREPPAARSIVVNLNGGEEAGLFGAAGFLQHHWARDVRAYLYLEAFPGGKAGLFGAGPGNRWLADLYARVAPSPIGNVVGQELAQSGLLPHNGDFTPFHEAGLAGLDVAMTGDGWAYHTALDRSQRLQPGGLQHMGDTAVAVVRAMANFPLPTGAGANANANAGAGPAVYYDLLGLTMVAYGAGTGRGLALAALLLGAVAMVILGRRRVLSLGAAVGALAWTTLAAVAGLMGAVSAGLLVALALGRPHGWFSAPVLVLPAFAAPALAAMLGVHALWRRRALRHTGGVPAGADRHGWAVWTGALLFWCAWLALSALAGVAVGYLALYPVAGAALGMISTLIFPRSRSAAAILSVVPGAVVNIELGVLFLTYFLPITGMVPASLPFDPFVAGLVGAVAVSVGTLAFVAPHRVGGFGTAAVTCAVVGALGVALTASRFPYTEQRPKRLLLAHAADEQGSAVLLRAADALGMGPLLPSLGRSGVVPVPAHREWPPYETWWPPFTHEFPAPPPPLAAPDIEVTFDAYDAQTDRRELRLRVRSPGAQARLIVPSARLAGWSLAPSLEATLAVRGQHVVHFEGLSDDGCELSLNVRGRAPLRVELRAIGRTPPTDPVVEAVKQRLPTWTTTTAVSVRVVHLTL